MSRMVFLSYTFVMRVFKWLGFVGVVALVGLGVRNLVPKAKTTLFLWQENKQLQSELAGLKVKQHEAAERLHKLALPRFVEQEARIRLQLRRPGEEVAVIVPSQEALTKETPPEAAATSAARAWRSLVKWARRLVP